MKVICETRKEIEIVKSCKKEFCCKGLERAFETVSSDHEYGGEYTSNMRVNGDIVEMIIHANYDTHFAYEKIDYCPFCGTKIVIDKIQIDNTGITPTRKVPKGEWGMAIDDKETKKKHWWWRYDR